MTSVIYASLAAALVVWLSFNVIKTRRRLKIRYGDGGNEELIIARSTHSNATEYIPLSLILLFALEYNQASLWLVHALGIALVAGRVMHARGMLTREHQLRVLGMRVTLATIIFLAVLNPLFLLV